MRHISFALTTPQFRARIKRVTRRKNWLHAKPGDMLQAIEKGMGLKKGEHPVKLGVIKVLSTRREPLNAITPEDVIAEGFPGCTPEWFINFYCDHNGGLPDQLVTRIEFEYV